MFRAVRSADRRRAEPDQGSRRGCAASLCEHNDLDADRGADPSCPPQRPVRGRPIVHADDDPAGRTFNFTGHRVPPAWNSSRTKGCVARSGDDQFLMHAVGVMVLQVADKLVVPGR